MNGIFKKIICGITTGLFLTAFAQNYTVEDLLCGYLENDLELQKLTLGVEKSQLALEQTKIDQGFDITLSTGTMQFSSDSTGSKFSVKPSLTASVAKFKNLKASVSTEYRLDTDSSTNTFEDTKFNIGIDIFSQTEAIQKVNLMKSERELVEAKRKLQSSALSAERKFYGELKTILSEINSIFTYMQDVYTNKLAFEKIKAQGYGASSSTYRIAEMKVLTGEHDIQTSVHNLNHDFMVFYQRCGISLNTNGEKDFLKFIPENIPESELIKFEDLPSAKYKEIENAEWIYNINTLTRKADKFVSLGVNGGYTINNSFKKADTVDVGVSTMIGGIGFNAGVSLPVGANDMTPAFNLSATISPNGFRTRNIKDKTYELTAQQELVDIKSAKQDYETAIVDYNSSRANLIWEKDSVADSFDLYQKNETDLEKFYKMGIVTESEYLTARNNRQLYQVKMIINKIDYLIYNNDVRSQFVDLEDVLEKTQEN